MITKEELGAVLYALGQRPTVTEIQSLIRSVDLDSKSVRVFLLVTILNLYKQICIRVFRYSILVSGK